MDCEIVVTAIDIERKPDDVLAQIDDLADAVAVERKLALAA
jgi:hypothetical protein